MQNGAFQFSQYPITLMLTSHNFPGPVPHFHTASNGKLGACICEQGSITLKRISQLGSDVHVVLIVCVQWIMSLIFLLQERTEEVQICS